MKTILFTLLLLSVPACADIVTIEADDFAAGTNISNAYENITLWKAYRRQDNPIDIDWIKYECYTEIYAQASTDPGKPLGDNVIGRIHSSLPDYWIELPTLFIEINGLAKTFSVSSAPRPNYISASCTLDLYDADGVRIGHNFKSTGGTVISYLSDYSAKYAFIWSSKWMAVDHIVIDYQPIPEPSTLLLLTLSGLLAHCRRIR